MPNTTRLLAVACLLGLVACGSREPPVPESETGRDAGEMPATPPPAAPAATARLQMGKGVDDNKNITGATTSFGTRDTIYVAVRTEDVAPGARLTAKWTFQDGQVVEESSETITAGGSGVTEFHIMKPTAWPAGTYRVEVMMDGQPVGSQQFTVQ
ncbi:MAG: hypothetical protein ACREMH_11355 [Gemmatimonadales bacterium]